MPKAQTTDRYAAFLPNIAQWIHATLAAYTRNAKPVVSFGFQRLLQYFSHDFLSTANVVITDDLPMPPLSSWGLSEFASFDRQPMSAITYLDTYFIHPGSAANESVHFHELVHVIQWQVLGPREFLLLYASGLVEHKANRSAGGPDGSGESRLGL
jgi:hypothetical protein